MTLLVIYIVGFLISLFFLIHIFRNDLKLGFTWFVILICAFGWPIVIPFVILFDIYAGMNK